ncbi:MAG TPA: hypothetical protein PLM81_04865 [Ginsengibacter sp.]|nr:hypothetical protein [Ginsengibacter sp.]HRP16826.1 hypothetical protein [Ginsengibacter sp.]HRP43737.1 hypothetical protein [Ginsengibacter sp.]
MKQVLSAAVIMMLVYGCAHKLDLSEQIPGTYFLTLQTVEQEDGRKATYKDLKQLKIYTDKQFMYAQINPADSTSSFGVGGYSTEGDTLVEHVLYSSRGSGFADQPVDHSLFIKITGDGYSQIINGIQINGISSILTENYDRSSPKPESPLDGVWKEVKGFGVSATNDTTVYNRTQYKAFWNGYFMFGHTNRSDSGRVTTGMGFGNFEMVSDKQFKETDLNSSYAIIAGNTFTIDLDMPDKDHFTQTIKNSDGSYSVESYERLK